ncbi:membrane protein [gut metagenome]|uniref:Membrane protein n=1 Tax=gut metagenome TaxID=749906 RepID=J9FY45_9ZZZZ
MAQALSTVTSPNLLSTSMPNVLAPVRFNQPLLAMWMFSLAMPEFLTSMPLEPSPFRVMSPLFLISITFAESRTSLAVACSFATRSTRIPIVCVPVASIEPLLVMFTIPLPLPNFSSVLMPFLSFLKMVLFSLTVTSMPTA